MVPKELPQLNAPAREVRKLDRAASAAISWSKDSLKGSFRV